MSYSMCVCDGRGWRTIRCCGMTKEYIIGRPPFRMTCCDRIWSECARCRCDDEDKKIVRTARMVPQLRTLFMRREKNSQILREICRYWPNLTTLRFHISRKTSEFNYRQKISCSLLSYIFKKCPKIEKLVISDSLLSDQRYAELVSRLEQLRSLKVVSNGKCTGPVLLRFLADNCPRLQEIDLSCWTRHPLEDVEYFVRTRREVLVSAAMSFVMVGLRSVVPMLRDAGSRLERLKLYHNQVRPEEEAATFSALGQLHSLRELTVPILCPKQPHLVSLAFQPGCLPLLQKLHLPMAIGLTDDTIIAISQGCPVLRELRVVSSGITDGALTKIHCLKHLQILDLGGGNRLGGSAVAHIAQLPALRTLILRQTGDLRRLQPGLRHLLNMRELRCLDILHCEGIEAVPFAEFPGALVNLRELRVDWISKFTHNDNHIFYEKVFSDLRCQMPHLRVIHNGNWKEDNYLTDNDDDDDIEY